MLRKGVIPIDQENLISKKALLERYGISYGALYRWKRQGLIPEEWFIKKATVTGQETFFPEILICERVELILSEKNEQDLSALARRLRGETERHESLTLYTVFGEKRLRREEIKRITVQTEDGETDVTDRVLALFGQAPSNN